MHLTKLRITEIVFLIVLIVSLISLARATVSYTGFYNALKNLQVEASNVDLFMLENNAEIVVDLEIVNPTWYDGLRLTSIISTLSYEGENHTVRISPGGPRTGIPYQEIPTRWWTLPEKENIIDCPITPSVPIKTRLNLSLTGNDSMHLIEFYEKQGKYQEYISWRMESRVYIKAPFLANNLGLEYEFDLRS